MIHNSFFTFPNVKNLIIGQVRGIKKEVEIGIKN